MPKDGQKVKVEYEGTLEDGTVFDSSERTGQALEFEVGSEMIIKGFEDAIKKMKVGDEKTISLDPADAYGEPREDLVKKVPKKQIPTDQEIKTGMIIMIGLPTGQQLPATIKEVGDKEITLDLNHPLAGKKLTFKLKLLEVN